MFVPLRRRQTSSVLPLLRHFRPSARTGDYVGPPDPVSNIRPVLYDDPSVTNAEPLRHPYALDEFRDDSYTLEYQWKLHRQQLDAFNDSFWRDVRRSHPSLLPPISCNSCRADKHTLRGGQGCRREWTISTRHRGTTRGASLRVL